MNFKNYYLNKLIYLFYINKYVILSILLIFYIIKTKNKQKLFLQRILLKLRFIIKN
jgi:hypothetical protein